MNDEQFEAAMDYLGDEGQVSITQQLRARDNAQREALARLQADHEANGLEYGEALILIGQVLDCRSLEDLNAVRRYLNEFMDRYSLRPVPDVDLAQAEQQEATKRGKPDWDSHNYDQIFQTSDGNWFGARAGWDFKGHISDQWKGREVSLLRDDGGFLAYGEPNPDWENSLEQRPVQEARCESCDGTGDVHRFDGEWLGTCPCPAGKGAQGAQARDERAAFLVVGVVDYESTEALAAFLDRSQAESWLAEIETYQERHPGWWSHDASEQEQDAACEKLESWRKGHPAGVSASSCDSFHVMEIPLRAALATQPAVQDDGSRAVGPTHPYREEC